ncbi:terpenoid synthase [Exidia glandulosa HHB12029]|uniref:Terpenoid synthase n=1 Tax=Exidia glandulosa HHB12029 TaxID=1314781 RepID=A0A165MUV7_EXIGL|nr:terpenoid synthase [Exidia glandulosa HHB12029]
MAARVNSEARRLGIPIDGLAPFIPAGATMASTLYAHLPSQETRTVICLLTAYFLYIEDLSERDIVSVREFNSRFARGERQRDPTLDGFARVLGELSQLFPPIAANIITTSFLNFVTGTLLEQETQNTMISKDSERYATMMRTLSGAAEAYAFFVFPAELPVQSYIQTIPDLVEYLCSANDILSFYKEELAGETVNQVSLLAVAQGRSKADVLAALVAGCVSAHERTQRLLQPHPEALKAYLAFARGYIEFHVVTKRYRLHELDL